MVRGRAWNYLTDGHTILHQHSLLGKQRRSTSTFYPKKEPRGDSTKRASTARYFKRVRRKKQLRVACLLVAQDVHTVFNENLCDSNTNFCILSFALLDAFVSSCACFTCGLSYNFTNHKHLHNKAILENTSLDILFISVILIENFSFLHLCADTYLRLLQLHTRLSNKNENCPSSPYQPCKQ